MRRLGPRIVIVEPPVSVGRLAARRCPGEKPRRPLRLGGPGPGGIASGFAERAQGPYSCHADSGTSAVGSGKGTNSRDTVRLESERSILTESVVAPAKSPIRSSRPTGRYQYASGGDS